MNVRSVAVLITLLIFLTIEALSQSNQVPDNIELQVLKDLFDSLDGPSWKKKTNWPTKPVDSPALKKTHGCLRVFDTDIAKLKDITDALMSADPDEIGGKVTVSSDLKDFLMDDGKDKEEQTKNFWRGFDEALGQGLDNLEQWLKANGFK